MGKKFEIQAINYALYDLRNKKKVTLKEAAKALRISKLHLKLIERGYLHVSKRLQPRFITYYHLNINFFKNNTTYISPVEVTYEDPELDKKIRANIKKKKTKIVSGVISIAMIGLLALGLYYYNRQNVSPRDVWTKEYTAFREQLINSEFTYEEPSTEYPGDINYVFDQGKTKNCSYRINMPGRETHAAGMFVNITYRYVHVNVSVYNHKKILEIETDVGKQYQNPHYYAICTYTKKGEYNLPKVYLEGETGFKDYYPESQEYKNFYSLFFGEEGYESYIELIDGFLQEYGFNYKYDQLLDDTQKISEHEVFDFGLGFRLILFPSILLVLTLSIFVYALFKGRKIKPKKVKARPYVVHKTEYTADAALVYRSVPNDTKFPMIVPEFILRIVALGFLLVASMGMIWLTQATLVVQDSIIFEIGGPNISNLFVAGITLAFFLKLDVYHKRGNRELLENIMMLFVFGLMFYIAECLTYACISSQSSIYAKFAGLLTTLLPGNIIWNLMMYSLIFFFLFTLPKKLEDAPHKVLIWRLGSVIPSLLLLVAFIYKGTFQGVMSPYISFLFHTNGILSTAFAIFYLYALFFFQQYVSLKYGKDFTKVFLDSRRYALNKNIIACIVLLVLSGVDLLFYFYLPYNSLNLGHNWIIAILIPFILFYRPHIGKRSPKWDLAYTLMYVVCLTAGFVVSFNMIANTLDLSQISQIIS